MKKIESQKHTGYDAKYKERVIEITIAELKEGKYDYIDGYKLCSIDTTKKSWGSQKTEIFLNYA